METPSETLRPSWQEDEERKTPPRLSVESYDTIRNVRSCYAGHVLHQPLKASAGRKDAPMHCHSFTTTTSATPSKMELPPEIWSHVFSFVRRPSRSGERPAGAWRDAHQHDLTTVMRVSKMFYAAAAPHLYARPSVRDLPAFMAARPENLAFVRDLILYSPDVNPGRERSPVFMSDPVYPTSKRTMARVKNVLDTLDELSDSLDGKTDLPLPQLRSVTLAPLANDKWRSIEYKHDTRRLFTALARHPSCKWTIWPVHGPYSVAQNVVAPEVQYCDSYPEVYSPRLVLLQPLILDWDRELNWPMLKKQLKAPVTVCCRLVPDALAARKQPEYDEEWEKEMVEKINAELEEEGQGFIKLQWQENAVRLGAGEYRGRGRR